MIIIFDERKSETGQGQARNPPWVVGNGLGWFELLLAGETQTGPGYFFSYVFANSANSIQI